jgi:hypothetical protein
VALEVGEIVGMTCEGKPGHLRQVLGTLIAENLGSGIGGEGQPSDQ